jgi:hypothetical protein
MRLLYTGGWHEPESRSVRLGGCSVLAKRYGYRKLLRENSQRMLLFVNSAVDSVKHPHHDEITLRQCLGLLKWFALIHPWVFGIAVPIISQELVGHLTRRVGLLGFLEKGCKRRLFFTSTWGGPSSNESEHAKGAGGMRSRPRE